MNGHLNGHVNNGTTNGHHAATATTTPVTTNGTTNGIYNAKVVTPSNGYSNGSSNGGGCSAADKSSPRSMHLRGYVGFDKLAKQFVSKSVKEGFAFNILCIGKFMLNQFSILESYYNPIK